MEEAIFRPTELLEMDPEVKKSFDEIAAKYKYKVDLQREMRKAGFAVSMPTLYRLLDGKGNRESLEKAKGFIESQAA